MTAISPPLVRPPRFKSMYARRAIWGYFFIAPALLYFVVWVALPVLTSFVLSFTDYNIAQANWIGLNNYIKIVETPEVWDAFGKTFQFGIELIPLNMMIALALAMLVDRKLRGIGIFRTIYYMPVLTSLVVAGVIWSAMYDPRTGPINALLNLFGVAPQTWLRNPDLALHSVVIVRVWKGAGYNMMVFLAGLQTIPAVLYEAAEIDGASPWQKFRYVTWPMLKPTTYYIFVMACISAFQVFGEIYLMTRGGPAGATRTLMYSIYEQAFEYSNMGYASALGFVLFTLVAAISIFNLTVVSRGVDYER